MNLNQSCTWKAGEKTYISNFTKNGTAVSCSVEFLNATVADSAVITVTGFNISADGSKFVDTTSKLQVGSKSGILICTCSDLAEQSELKIVFTEKIVLLL